MDLNNIKSTSKIRPPRIILYGPPGIGKSTWASNASHPLFLDIEGGLDFINVPRTPINELHEIYDIFSSLEKEDHPYKTLVIDSLDWLEKIIHLSVCNKEGVKNMLDIPFGRGYQIATIEWKKIIDSLNLLRGKKEMMIILLAHAQVKRFEDPMVDDYDRFNLKLHRSGESIVTEFSDCIFFATQKVYLLKKKGVFGREIIKPKTGDERVIYTTQSPSFIAKNRYNLPHEIPLHFKSFRDSFLNQIQQKGVTHD